MLTAIVFELTAIKEATIPASHGAMAYAAALDLILRQDVKLARDLHDKEGSKPLKVGSLQGEQSGIDRQLKIISGQRYNWRLAAVEERTATCLAALQAGGGVRIGDAVFEISGAARQLHEHCSAGQTTYQALAEKYMHTVALPATLTLDFVTPTTFRAGSIEQPFPIPTLVFQSLARQWVKWSDISLPADGEALKANIILANWQGETKRVELGGRRTVGFVGRYTYRITKASPEIAKTACLLADYAFYTGIGWQTAHGMGQVRRIMEI